MKTLLVFLLCNCLLVTAASGQSHVQLGERLGQFADQMRKRGGNDNRRVQNELISPRQTQQQEPEAINRREATDLARGAYPGRVLGIRREGDHWRVRMDDGGTVFNVFVDAENGAVARPSE